MHCFLRGFLVIALLGSASSALAQAAPEPTAEQRARARGLYGQGQAHFTAHEYQPALDAFQAAFREVPNPVVLLGVASAQEQLGHREEARETLERYLVLRPDAPDRASVESRIAALPVSTQGSVHVVCTPADASIELDGRAIGTGTADTRVAPGSHQIRVALTGHEPITRAIDVVAGHRVDLELALVAATTTTTTTTTTTVSPTEVGAGLSEDDVFGGGGARESEETTATETTETPVSTDPPVSVWVATAVAGVTLVTGTVMGFLALSKQSDFDAAPTASTANDGEAFALVADISFAVAGIAGITAIVLYATQTPAPSSSTASFQIVPLASPTCGGVAVGGRF